MNPEQLARLHHLVHAAQATVDRPWLPGEVSRPIEFFTDHLEDEGWRLGWALVAALRETAADLFRSYSEQNIHRVALDHLVSAAAPPRLAEIAEALRTEAADGDGDWVLLIPLANAVLGRPWAPLGESAALLRSPEAHRIEDDAAREPVERAELDGERAAFLHLGDRLAPAGRIVTLGDGTERDTGRTVSLLAVERGSAFVAIEGARAKTQYALATWSVLAPPADWHLLPDLAIWTPQPYLQQRVQHKRLEQSRWITRETRRGGDYRHWAPYELPADDVLAAPYEAFQHLDQRSAQALLSATAAVHSGSRATRSQLSERIRDVRAAIECLCEPPPGATGNVRTRWERLGPLPGSALTG